MIASIAAAIARAMAGEGVSPNVHVDFKYSPTEIVAAEADKDLIEAVGVAHGNQVKTLAESKSGCRTPAGGSRLQG